MKKVSVKYLIILIVPIFIELVLQLLAGNVDKIMVQSDSLATAINQANSVLDLLIVAISVLASSSLILINQYKGAKLKNEEEEVYRLSYYFYLFVGIILSLLLLALSKPILLLMQVDELEPNSLIDLRVRLFFNFLRKNCLKMPNKSAYVINFSQTIY